MSNSVKKKKKKESGGAPSWMVTYSDMVTLLLTFFVLMMSMARLDQIKFQRAMGSLRGAFGVLESSSKNTEPSEYLIREFGPIPYEMVQRVYKRIQSQMDKLELNENIDLVKDRGAVILRVNEKVLFDSGKAGLKKSSHSVLRKVANLVRPFPLDLRIEGHTDNRPLSVPSRTNWDLSVDRAVSVLKFFADRSLLPLNRMSAVGYGSQHPLVPNNSEENRALNRRVEFVLESSGNYKEELPYLIDARDQLPF